MSSSSHLCQVFSQSRSNYLAFRTRVLLSLLLDLDTYSGVDSLGVFPLFFPLFFGCVSIFPLKMVAGIIAPKLKIFFLGLMRRDRFRSAGGLLI